MIGETEGRTVEDPDFGASRRIWQEEMDTGPDPYADPALWIDGSGAKGDERSGR